MTTYQPKQHGNYYERQAYREMRKAEIAEEKARKAAHAMTCQCCGRDIFAQTGTIAHHGYERPGTGWQTASCMGAKHLPFEVSRDRLGDLIARIKQDIMDARQHLADVRDEKTTVPFFWTAYEETSRPGYSKAVNHRYNFDRAYFDALCESIDAKMLPLKQTHTVYGKEYKDAVEALPSMDKALWDKIRHVHDYNDTFSFDQLKEAEINSTLSRLGQLKSFLKECETRFRNWKQTHTHFDKTTQIWVCK